MSLEGQAGLFLPSHRAIFHVKYDMDRLFKLKKEEMSSNPVPTVISVTLAQALPSWLLLPVN